MPAPGADQFDLSEEAKLVRGGGSSRSSGLLVLMALLLVAGILTLLLLARAPHGQNFCLHGLCIVVSASHYQLFWGSASAALLVGALATGLVARATRHGGPTRVRIDPDGLLFLSSDGREQKLSWPTGNGRLTILDYRSTRPEGRLRFPTDGLIMLGADHRPVGLSGAAIDGILGAAFVHGLSADASSRELGTPAHPLGRVVIHTLAPRGMDPAPSPPRIDP
jgi:hypothetical protein